MSDVKGIACIVFRLCRTTINDVNIVHGLGYLANLIQYKIDVTILGRPQFCDAIKSRQTFVAIFNAVNKYCDPLKNAVRRFVVLDLSYNCLELPFHIVFDILYWSASV